MSHLSRLMDIQFAEYMNKFLKVYIDDLLVYSNSFDEHLLHIEKTLAKLAQAGLRASLEKTMWAASKVPYLGYILSPGKVEMDPDKVADALNIPTPDKVINLNTAKPQSLRKLVRIFLGLTGFYRSFIKGYATLAKPLYELTCTNIIPVWKQAHEQAWNNLKVAIAKKPVLVQPVSSKGFVVETDASNVGLGAVLSQMDENKVLRPCAFASRKLSPQEIKYSVRELEALAIVWAIDKFSTYLRPKRIVVLTDHSSVQWLLKQD